MADHPGTRVKLPILLAAMLAAAAPSHAAPAGLCRFEAATMSFAGAPAAQARCLLRPVLRYAHVGQESPLPPTLASLIGNPVAVDRALLQAFLRDSGVGGVRALADRLNVPTSRARDNSPSAPAARYFVIHDTSTPNFGTDDDFPDDINSSDHVNRFTRYPTGASSKAHFFVNRPGEVAEFRDFRIPWRATKLELDVVGTASRGLFLHIELIQPRRDDDDGIDAFAPNPGFTQQQYDRLATLYLVASFRAGQWLIPAYHTTLDHGLDDGHDDPQNFELTRFDAALAAQLERVQP